MNGLRNLFKNKKIGSSLITAAIIGIMLMIMGNDIFEKEKKEEEASAIEKEEEVNCEEYEKRLERRLENILGDIEGVGKIEVMVTVENKGEITVDKEKNTEREYDTNKGTVQKGRDEEKTVILNSCEPLVLKETEPKVCGVLIICQGGGNIETKKSLINAVKALLNVEIHKIEVLKMK